MDVCLMIEGQEGVSWEQWTSLALACEEYGFGALFRSDHYLSMGRPTEHGALDAWATLAALAASTSRIRLGTLVSPVTFRHPANLGKAVVTADHVSEGRVELGMGAGWFEAEHRAYGFPFPPVGERYEMLEEQVEIVHRMWDRDEEEVTFEGAHYQVKGCHALPKPVQDPHPPLILGGEGGPRSLRLAARWADEYNANFCSAERCAQVREDLTRACEAQGRDPTEVRLSLMTTTVIGQDQDGLDDRVGQLLERRGDSRAPAEWIESVREERIVGTTEQVLERLAAYAQAGVERVMLQHLLYEDLEAVALIGQDVIPEASNL